MLVNLQTHSVAKSQTEDYCCIRNTGRNPCGLVRSGQVIIYKLGLLFFFLDLIFIHISLCVFACVFDICRCLWRPEEGIRFLGDELTGSCEPSDSD